MEKKRSFVVIGAGVAGLTAAIALTELGHAPVVVDIASAPSHKLCGEFLSPGCIDTLKAWNIHPHPISKASIATPNRSIEFILPKCAGALSHMELDPQLWQRAESQGSIFMTGAGVKEIIPRNANTPHHHITLSSGVEIQCTDLIIATGRIPSLSKTAFKPKYKAFKAHFTNIPIHDTVMLFASKEAYMGVAPVSKDVCNIAGLVSFSEFEKHKNIEIFFSHMISESKLASAYLSERQNLFPSLMTADVPEFGCKSPPPWIHTYLIGDAAATIPPTTGNGLSMAIASGLMAAHYANAGNYSGYRSAWSKRFYTSILCGKALHSIMMRPTLTNGTLRGIALFPKLAHAFYRLTRSS